MGASTVGFALLRAEAALNRQVANPTVDIFSSVKHPVKRTAARKMTTILARLPREIARALKPSFAEFDHYARIILRHEGRPRTALAACRREAEIQLWTMRALAVVETEAATADPLPVRKARRNRPAPREIIDGTDLRELALA